MSKHSTSSDKGHYEPGNPLEKLHEEMKSGLLASGRTVREKAPSDTNEFTATFPQGRRPGPARGSGPARARTGSPQSRKVSVGVEWGYEFHSVTLSAKRWAEIKNGAEVVATSKGAYEGTKFRICWHFNCQRRGSLVVSYGDDGADGFIGSLQNAVVADAGSE